MSLYRHSCEETLIEASVRPCVDDIAILSSSSSSYSEMQELLEAVSHHALTLRLFISGEQRQAVLLGNEALEDVDKCKCNFVAHGK